MNERVIRKNRDCYHFEYYIVTGATVVLQDVRVTVNDHSRALCMAQCGCGNFRQIIIDDTNNRTCCYRTCGARETKRRSAEIQHAVDNDLVEVRTGNCSWRVDFKDNRTSRIEVAIDGQYTWAVARRDSPITAHVAIDGASAAKRSVGIDYQVAQDIVLRIEHRPRSGIESPGGQGDRACTCVHIGCRNSSRAGGTDELIPIGCGGIGCQVRATDHEWV